MGAGTATKQKESQNKSNQNQSNEIKEVVKKKLGLVDGKATNLTGKDQDMYGSEASKFTDDALVKDNIVKVGSYFKKEGGNFIRISKAEGEKLYAAGDPSVSRSVIGNSNALKIKYGSSNSAMGSGDPTGAMTSVPISSKMLQQQNKIKGITTAVLSLAAPAPVGAVLRTSAATNLLNASQPDAAYKDYKLNFDAKQEGKKFTQTRNELGILKLGLSKGKDKLGEIIGN
tara:strand:+ start:285 stop:971 length:687 start_codon:yes stop_codon:yes gene_type:complete